MEDSHISHKANEYMYQCHQLVSVKVWTGYYQGQQQGWYSFHLVSLYVCVIIAKRDRRDTYCCASSHMF